MLSLSRLVKRTGSADVRSANGMWDGRRASRLQTLRHEVRGVIQRFRNDRRFLPRDISRLLLGGWRTRRAVTWLIARFRPRSRTDIVPAAVETVVGQLLERGYSGPLGLVLPEQVQEIHDYFLDQTYIDPHRPQLGRFRYPDAPSPESNQGYYDLKTILQAPYILSLINHPVVLATAERILGCKPTIDNLGCWWYFTGRAVEKGFQRYHRDYDTPRFIKLFLFLTDTDESSGAQRYVIGSHCSNRLMLLRYIDDDEVAVAYGLDAVHTIGGPAGTCFLVDTFGVHKGGLPITRPRLVFSAQYNIWGSPFAPVRPIRIPDSDRYDRFVTRQLLLS